MAITMANMAITSATTVYIYGYNINHNVGLTSANNSIGLYKIFQIIYSGNITSYHIDINYNQ